MKKIILLLMVSMVSLNIFGQLSKIEEPKIIGEYEIAPMGSFIAKRIVYDDGVTILFRDIKYTTLMSIKSFDLTTEDDANLSKLLLSSGVDGDKYKLKTISGDELHIEFKTQLGITYPQLSFYDSSYHMIQYMTERQLKKLFNIK